MSCCKACGAPILWAIASESNRRIPLDPEPVPNGNLRVEEGPGGLQVAYYEAARTDVVRHKAHFATCPKADEMRRAGSKKGKREAAQQAVLA